jgi:hypothetical protein
MEKLWERFYYSLEDPNPVKGLSRLVNNAETISDYLEANNILTEARKTVKSLKIKNKKISLTNHNRTIDNILVYIFLKSITTIPSKTKAFKLGLIDKNGKLVRNPANQQEEDAISNLDLLMFKLREWLKPRMSCLMSVNWLSSAMGDIRLQNCLTNTESLSKQYIIHRLNDELDTILRKH